MQKRMTISIDEIVYNNLHRKIGRRRISRFIEETIRPLVLDSTLDAGYKAMASDHEREVDAQEWCNVLAGDLSCEAR